MPIEEMQITRLILTYWHLWVCTNWNLFYLFIYNFIVQYCYRSMEDFITWVDSSKIKQHVMNYN